ncbi:DUF5392 family protein [Alkalihalobacterium sp. APHAB7]|uniref:DUF5392 family protein n=1 Tax=Alkalihalobacterium sp. APHAB7 TaxID=3402081 RepID=UPI003AAEA3EB
MLPIKMDHVSSYTKKEFEKMHKEIYNTSINYIKERMMKSEIVPDYTRDRFIEKVSSEPMNGLQTFSDFLHQEERMEKMGNS